MTENKYYIDDRKLRIRERYKGSTLDDVEIIPAAPQENIYDSEQKKRVAVYARVSTDDPRQTSSFELQKNHYTDFVSRRSNWTLVGIYADEGISGTSLQHRDAFLRMIDDCLTGKIDLIVTKSVSRFARNILDCIGYVRQLAGMKPPVGVFFETENIYTLDSSSEMILSFMATMAQEESHNKSEIMNASIDMRFHRGILLTPPLLGYDQDENGKLVINQKEAETVRLIFFMYLFGYTCVQISDTLTKLERHTKKNNTTWSPGSILQILQNERCCGDVLARKTWTPNYLDHKSVKNKNNRNQYKWKNTHDAIISRDDFIAVQRLISNARYGNKGILPELHVIQNGALKGFVGVNPHWAVFKAADYRSASESVYDGAYTSVENEPKIEAKSGDFDLRGFEIARAQFFDTAEKICITFSSEYIVFSAKCIRRFDKAQYIEMLVHPGEYLLVVRPCAKEVRNAIRWAKQHDGQYFARSISCAAYIKTLFELFGWKLSCKYRIRGVFKQKDEEAVVVFNMQETEIFIPQDALDTSMETQLDSDLLNGKVKPFTNGPKKDIMAYPATWANNFGNNFYRNAQACELMAFDRNGTWNVHEQGQPFSDSPPLSVTNAEVAGAQIKQLICNMQQEVDNDRE
ncbi:recombinase family protein [Caproiciproducens sp.]|uniref:recombinase family protein n=1 Tax=Caproiciproducens sp. TaxID=1954376 RepID=UPI002897E741|nr:recombinase family protein [Caproiciproducens sp.]